MNDKVIVRENVVDKIYVIRNQKVMLDRDLAALYDVETKRLKEAVRRNISRFPQDFMFELSKDEFNNWRTQFASSNSDRLGLRYSPMAFTEHGILMLSSVLNSEQAIQTNIQIMRIFAKTRQMLVDQSEIRIDVEKIKKTLDNHGKNIELVFHYLDEVLEKKENAKPREKIGFKK